MPYLNVEEVETAIALAAGPSNAAFTQLIALPHATIEGRTCHALRIGAPSAWPKPAVYLLGGVHAREWGSPDILVNLVEQLTAAYQSGSAITQGSHTVSAGDVRTIVETLDLIVFPQANPDGRRHSMTVDPMWRKNRRPAPSSAPNCAGVDVNRNYDWMWHYPTYFDPQSGVVNSTAPCSDVYIGTAAFSEPETQNAQWLMDAFPAIGYFIDVHSFGDDILYNWGDDDDQSTDPAMNFRNAAYDGKRGVVDSSGMPNAAAYREYIATGDKQLGVSLANRLNYGIQAAHGRSYTVKQSCNLYPTAGTSDDYAYARHLVNPAKGKIISYTLEWGPDYSQPGSTPHWTVPQCFHPTYSDPAAPTDMTRIIEEVTSGLLEFCLGVVHPPELPGSHHMWELVARILFGVINDGGGLEWLPGRGPVPVDPWGPLRVAGMPPESRDALIGLALRELGRGLADEKSRERVEALAGRLVGQGKRIAPV